MLQFCHQGPERGDGIEVGVAGQHRGRGFARLDDRGLVAEHAQLLERAVEARLRTTEDVALTPLLEIDPAELEAVGGGCHCVEALARRTVLLGARDEETETREAAASD